MSRGCPYSFKKLISGIGFFPGKRRSATELYRIAIHKQAVRNDQVGPAGSYRPQPECLQIDCRHPENAKLVFIVRIFKLAELIEEVRIREQFCHLRTTHRGDDLGWHSRDLRGRETR